MSQLKRPELWLALAGLVFLTLGITFFHLLRGPTMTAAPGSTLHVFTSDDRTTSVYTTEQYGYADCTVTAADGREVPLRSDMTAQDVPGWYHVGEIVGENEYFVTCSDRFARGTFSVGPTYGIGTVLTRWLLFIAAAGLIAGSVAVLFRRFGQRDRRSSG